MPISKVLYSKEGDEDNDDDDDDFKTAPMKMGMMMTTRSWCDSRK